MKDEGVAAGGEEGGIFCSGWVNTGKRMKEGSNERHDPNPGAGEVAAETRCASGVRGVAVTRREGTKAGVPEYAVEAATVLRCRKAKAAFEASQKEMLARIKDVA